MDDTRAHRSQRFREMCDEVWALRTELDAYQDELRALSRNGRHASDLELLQAAAGLRELARAAAALKEEARGLGAGDAIGADLMPRLFRAA
jgi:hypothetical protein